MIIFAVATVVSYVFYRRSKQIGENETKNVPIKKTLDSLHSFMEKSNVEENPEPIRESTPQNTHSEHEKVEFDLKTELEKVFVRKVEKGEIELDLVPVTDGRISKANLIEILGIPWMPKLKYTNPTEKIEEPTEPILVPQEEEDIDAIQVGTVQEPEADKTGKKKKTTVKESTEGGAE